MILPTVRHIVAGASIAVLVSGCVSVDFKEPVSGFADTMALSGTTLRSYYVNLNEYERQLYLDRLLVNGKLEVSDENSKGERTGLIAQFAPESIRARLDAITLLSKYGERLGALAGADAPQRFNTGAQTLGTNLLNLDKTFGALGKNDPTANQYVAPITAIIGAIGEMYLDKKRDEAITDAVMKGAPAVNEILDILQRDLNLMIEPLISTGASQMLTGAMEDYNNRKDGMTYEQRRESLQRIGSLAMQYELAVTNNPSDVVDGIRDAHGALVAYAESPRKPNDLASLVSAIELFNNRVRPVAEALAQARGAKS